MIRRNTTLWLKVGKMEAGKQNISLTISRFLIPITNTSTGDIHPIQTSGRVTLSPIKAL